MEQCSQCYSYTHGNVNGLCPDCQAQHSFDIECDGCGQLYRSIDRQVHLHEIDGTDMRSNFCLTCEELLYAEQ